MSLSKFLSAVVALSGAAGVLSFVDILLQGSIAISGADVNSMFGRDVKNIGDFNRDGVSDIMVSGFKCNEDGTNCIDVAYVLFGGPHVSSLDLAEFKSGPIHGFQIQGPLSSYHTISAISGAGDVNGDGFDDIMVQNHHSVAVIYGFNTTSQPVWDILLSRFHSNAEGFEIAPPPLSFPDEVINPIKMVLEGAGDVNGDGLDDMLVCYPEMSPYGRINAGLCYVIFGSAGDRDTLCLDHFNLPSMTTTTTHNDSTKNTSMNTSALGFRIMGASTGDRLGHSVLSNLDLNDDGVADIVLSLQELTYVVFGQKRGVFRDLDLAIPSAPTSVLQIKNLHSHGDCTYSLAALTDANGDGVNDLALGCATTDRPLGPNTGSVTVIYGRAECDPFVTHLDLNAFTEGVDGFRVYGPHSHAYFGQSVTNGGDLNGDGRTDLLVGAQATDSNNVVYVVYSTPPNTLTTTRTDNATTTTTTTIFSDIDLSIPFSRGEVTPIIGPVQNDLYAWGVVRNIGDFDGDQKVDFILTDPRGPGSGDKKSAGVLYVLTLMTRT